MLQICSNCSSKTNDIHHELDTETWTYNLVCQECSGTKISLVPRETAAFSSNSLEPKKKAKRRKISKRQAIAEQLNATGKERLELSLTRVAKSVPKHLPFTRTEGSEVIIVPRFDDKVDSLGESRYKDRSTKSIAAEVKLFNVQRMFDRMHERRKQVETDEYARKLQKCVYKQKPMKDRHPNERSEFSENGKKKGKKPKTRSLKDYGKSLKEHITLEALKEMYRVVKEEFLEPILTDLVVMKSRLPKSKQKFAVSPEMLHSVIDARYDCLDGDPCKYIASKPLTSKQVKRNLVRIIDEQSL